MRPVHDVGLPLLFAPVARVLRPLAAWLSETAPESLMRRARLTPTVLYRQVISLVMIAVACWMAGVLFQTCLELGASIQGGVRHDADRGVVAAAAGALDPVLHRAAVCCGCPVRLPAHAHGLPASSSVAGCSTGAAIGLLVLLHVRNTGLAMALAALAMRAARTRAGSYGALALLAGLALLLLVRTGINHAFWGTWVTTPHAALGRPAGMLPRPAKPGSGSPGSRSTRSSACCRTLQS